MQTAEIRGRWLDFFADRGHTVVPSASLVSDDPTLLFTVAGMVPFVPYLTGLVPAPYPRATSVQKCIRTNDIEEVGKTPRHGTFFQMNGNFSFGDYFKEQAIGYAWELLTTSEADGGYGFQEKDLWVTVYQDDDEAFRYWRALGLPEDRIQRLGMDSNYWSTGQPGPAGPCSEIFFDRGPAYGADGGPATDDDRYVEIWNLVFMQYLRGEGTGKNDFVILGDLPKKNIDTGMGLERVAFLKQGVENMYEIDQVRPVLDLAAALSGRRYGAVHDDDVRMRIVADHVRSSLMLMSDGVTPSNEGRGYILRRLMRRTVRAMRLLGVDVATFPELFPAARDAMMSAYPEVHGDYARISQGAYAEEETFLRTLASGSTVLDVAVAKTIKAKKTELPGDTAFLLHDTYGFPIEITLEMAEEAGLSVNRSAFDALMAKQRSMAKADAKAKKTHLADLSVYSAFRASGETVFTGYEELQTESSVLGIIVDGASVTKAVAGEIAEVILAETALYAESGGQEADAGLIVGRGYELEVLDVQKPVKGLISHKVHVTSGEVGVGDPATSVVDPDWRRGARQAHSGTHVLHAALRQVLGPNAHQSGSYNKAGFFRLDFSWNQALSAATRSEIEEISNNAIRDNLPVVTRELPLAEAKALGAMALFSEKYGDRVRVVDIGGPWSRELCAGTHVGSSAEIGMINLVSEASVGSTNRRVESLVGLEAFRDLAAERAIVSQLTANLKTPKEQLPERIGELLTSLKAAEKKIAAFEAKALTERVPALVATAQRAGAVRLVAENLGTLHSPDEVRMLVTATRAQLGSDPAVVALAAVVDDKPVIIVATNAAARETGQRAGALAKLVAGILGGGGGGKDDLAQGGGTDVDKIASALVAVRTTIAG
ncbi:MULTISPECIES: alanine--tRNA ligase [Cryobacterium]|uniref:Alanine--tRNA ligase n=1 Tax=Cryobacterium glucosi TaxID=1259175 RepID=A0ABY2ITK5_9MICO|nr:MULTISPECIES: alanine--tRNA ligase [Cryobacterium]MEB0285318.1 alanine--tRNA ligase [Cryobacterium sp. 10S3]MEB0304821.1 alanine--tRNA ligase [Cryobacterium sp. 10I1]TFC22639.1 alanine--tRNA ligase [Cryobacterium glucosi]WPX15335.1 alanine--tRNA ligase [Cryobacterium sp. 10S3]